MAGLELQGLKKSYGPVEILQGIDLSIEDGEFIVLVGPSGCGKSTLLRCIAGLEDITGGELRIDEKRVNEKAPKDRDIAMVFQSYALYPHMTVAENLAFALKLKKEKPDEIQRRVEEAVSLLGLDTLLARYPKQLSGGQRQRVAMGRALVRRPKVYLFDEPLSNLDAALRVQMRAELGRLHQQLQTTTIYVTHDQVEAMTLADRIVILNGGELQQVGAPLDVYHQPSNRFVAGFIGSPAMNFLPGDRSGGAVRVGNYTLPGSAPAHEADLDVGVRPEHIELDASEGLEAQIEVIEPMGYEALVHLSCGANNEHALVVRTEGERTRALRPKQTITLAFPEDRVFYFDRTSGARIT